MVLVDTSVWIDHLRSKNKPLIGLLEQNQVSIHPMVIGELACGHLQHRKQLLSLWKSLPHVTEASHDEVLHCLEQNRLMGKGVGFIDLHLLSSTLLSPNTFLWSLDRRLQKTAEILGISWKIIR